MKLCLDHNAPRLRLSAAEVLQFAAHGRLMGTVHFGPEPENCLTYTLERRPDAAQVSAEYRGRQITVVVPPAVADAWTSTAQNGFLGTAPGLAGQELCILVEKDLGHH